MYSGGHIAQASPVAGLNQDLSAYTVNNPGYAITKQAFNQHPSHEGTASIQWQPYQGARSKRPAKDEALWLTFDALRPQLTSDHWVLTIRLATLHHIQIFTYNTVTQESWNSSAIGLMHPQQAREKITRHPAFNLPLNHEQPLRVFVKIMSPYVVTIPMAIVKAKTFEAHSDLDLLVLGMILGTLLVMLLYNLSLYTLLRDPSYFYYSTYVLFALLYLTSLTGLGTLYVWPDNHWLVKYGTLTFAALSFLSATLFVRVFLKLKRFGGLVLHTNTVLLAIWSMLALALAFTVNASLFSILGLFSLLTCFIGLAVTVYLSIKKVPTAIIFTLAWLALIVGTIIFILMLKGILPFNIITAYAQMFGMVIELILLSFALAYRINLDRQKREIAQLKALALEGKVSLERNQRIQAQNETLSLQINQNKILEAQVSERTQQYEDAMVKLEILNGDLLALSLTDPLTKIANRRCFDRSLEDECRRAYRDQSFLAIVFVDIDFFKKVNDNYGHGVGDVCISTIAGLLNKLAGRSGDLVARYGGEEFVYMLSNTSEQDACNVAEKARESIETAVINTENGELKITASFGVASWVPKSAKEFPDFITRADDALYQAKKQGRNRVVAASTLEAKK